MYCITKYQEEAINKDDRNFDLLYFDDFKIRSHFGSSLFFNSISGLQKHMSCLMPRTKSMTDFRVRLQIKAKVSLINPSVQFDPRIEPGLSLFPGVIDNKVYLIG